MTSPHRLQFYTTEPHTCSYLVEKTATTLFVDPQHRINGNIYSQLSRLGFRRSGRHVYRPFCENCNACTPCRIPVEHFSPNRQQKRILNTNRDLTAREITDIHHPSIYAIYERYINERHRDGDMYPASYEQYESFLTTAWDITRFYGFYKDKQLLAVAVIDELDDGFSAVYTFFDPKEDRRSLGSHAILWQIQTLKERKLPYLYLGYWIKECRKMSYKSHYRPLEVFVDQQWLIND